MAIGYAEAVGDDGILADALAVQTMAEFLSGHGLDRVRLERALRLETPSPARSFVMRPRVIQGMLQLWTGELVDARDTLEAVHADVVERGQEGAAPMLALYVVWAHLWRGELNLASMAAARSLEEAGLLDDPAVSGIALAASALVHAHDGSTALARREAGEAIDLLNGLLWRSGLIWPMWALGLAELSAGNPAGVDALLGPLVEQVARMGAGDPVLKMFLPDEVEALIALGELDRAWPARPDGSGRSPPQRAAAEHSREHAAPAWRRSQRSRGRWRRMTAPVCPSSGHGRCSLPARCTGGSSSGGGRERSSRRPCRRSSRWARRCGRRARGWRWSASGARARPKTRSPRPSAAWPSWPPPAFPTTRSPSAHSFR